MPRLLVGPIVRRVEVERAHFFFATRVPGSMRVEVHLGRKQTGAAGPVATGTRALTRIGQHLYVALVTVQLPTVGPGQLCSYDAVLVEAGGEARLHQLGLLGGSVPVDGIDVSQQRLRFPLGYEVGKLPTFVTPVVDPGQLRIVHGSCRKPHGGGEKEADALHLLDLEFTRLTNEPLVADDPAERPQQLVLTGDQIYADDVAGALLHSCTEVGRELLGWDESLPATDDAYPVSPGWRTRYLERAKIKRDADTGYSRNHLLRFAEWCAMYLFAWSDALWATDPSTGAYTLPPRPSSPLGAPSHHADAVNAWEETAPKVLGFATSTCAVRRVLANVATYTMFDDHEVTDDWYLNDRVRRALKGEGQAGELGEVGPRLLRNGLSAYAIFQHWGNVPEDFDVDPQGNRRQGLELLDLWTWGGDTDPAPLTKHANRRAADELLDLGIDDQPIPVSGMRGDFERIRWDYAIAFPAHRLLALDTRTWRGFPDDDPFSWESLAPAPPPPGEVLASGGTYLQAVAQAWMTAGSTSNDGALSLFGVVLSSAVELAEALTDPVGPVHTKLTALLTAYAGLVAVLPGRAAVPPGQLLDGRPRFGPALLADTPALVSALDAFGDDELGALAPEIVRDLAALDFGPESQELGHFFLALAEFVATATVASAAGMANAAAQVASHAGETVWSSLTTLGRSVPAHVALLDELRPALQQLDHLAATTPVGRHAAKLFRDGSHRLGAALISRPALQFMVADALAATRPSPLTFVLSPAPIFGNRLVEVMQRTMVAKAMAAGEAGEEEWDFEAWSVNVPAMCDLFSAARELTCAIVLSGDVHYAGSSVNEVTLTVPVDGNGDRDGTPVRTRYVQLTSSSTRNSDGTTRALAHADDVLYDPDGTFLMLQSDWLGVLDHGAAAAGHLAVLAKAAIADLLDDLAGFDPLKPLRDWWAKPFDWEVVDELVQRILASPETLARLWLQQLAWEIAATADLIVEFFDDPLLAILGDFMTARELSRQLLRELYRDLGLDPSLGLKIEGTVLRDGRPARVPNYPALAERLPTGSRTDRAEALARRVVGHANLGFVGVEKRGIEIVQVRHELRWYPFDEPAAGGAAASAVPRGDVYGTLHRAGWGSLPGAPAEVGT
ncbi:hypothetical protein GCM10011354_04680 [Egicoccus halophilus]|uniref:PhoD-like phosphatase n=2 Tax=Egicoccus halophilus TaxID=1670830 RepID=A0A8J3ESK3_9ACTN|nr:hypothetical protein GCM10011354_04680 [Egicoccus halophilus]